MLTKKRVSIWAALALSAGTLTVAPAAVAAPAQPEVAQMAASVSVFVNCNADGSYAWTAVGEGFKPNTQHFVTSQASWQFSGGGGGWSETHGHGAQRSSSGGFVTTPTYYSGANTARSSVTVSVTITGVKGSDTDAC